MSRAYLPSQLFPLTPITSSQRNGALRLGPSLAPLRLASEKAALLFYVLDRLHGQHQVGDAAPEPT